MSGDGGRGWGAVAGLALVTAVLSVVHPGLLILVPLALLFVALPPHRPFLLAVAGLIGWMVFGRSGDGTLWYFERGYALVLGAWFVLLAALLPGWRFLSRALATLVLTIATALGFLLSSRGGLAQLDGAIAARLRQSASSTLAAWTRAVGADRVGEDVSRAVYGAAELQIRLYPSLLALASLAALGVAWWAFGRLARGERRPLRPLREFRFRDELVWLLIAAVALLALPLGEVATRTGQNLLTFMAALYALRGVAVLVVIGGGVPGPLGMVFGALLVVFMYPFVMATTFLVGLSDTWLDIRKRREASSTPGS